jgi:creatinine amidohydrolase/Fe(II)-dependent formamide hydrolase-like protein
MLARAWPLLCLVLVVAAPASAQPPDTVLLEELTWTELRDAIGAGKTTILVPVGGTEQNGPHMALGKHNVRVRALAERIARALGHALVAPVVAYVPEGRISPPTGHMRFPGTISVPEDTFERVLEAAARSFRQHGFRDVVFLGDHGATQAGQRAVATRLNREWAGAPTRAHAIEEYYRASQVEFARALRAKGYSQEEIGTHAGPRRHLRSCWRSTRGWCAPTGCARAPARPVTAWRATRAAPPPSWGARAPTRWWPRPSKP